MTKYLLLDKIWTQYLFTRNWLVSVSVSRKYDAIYGKLPVGGTAVVCSFKILDERVVQEEETPRDEDINGKEKAERCANCGAA